MEARQLNLFNDDLPHNGSATSRAAAKRHRASAAIQRSIVLAAVIRSPDGLTREQVSDVTKIDGNSVRPRVVELVKARLLKELGERPTRSGHAAAVLVPIHA